MKPIDRISRSTGWQPTDWQRKLCNSVPAMAVYGIFRDADYLRERRLLKFPHPDYLSLAEPYQEAVKIALGVTVMVSGGYD